MERPPQNASEPTSTSNSNFTQLLNDSIERLENDFTSGARQLADAALSDLSYLIDAAGHKAKDRDDLWQHAVSAAKALSNARPSMSAAVTSCLLRALSKLAEAWNRYEEGRGDGEIDVNFFVTVAMNVIEEMLEARNKAGVRLGESLAGYVDNGHKHDEPITILTLSNSSTVRTCLLTLLTTLPHLKLFLHILESRPRCEGADLASQLLSSLPISSHSRLHIRIFPDCAVGTALRGVGFVLLGADRISTSGDVSNKIGSMSAAVMAKREEGVKVVVVSEVDKIVATDMREGEGEVESHPASELMSAWAEDTRKGLDNRMEEGRVEVFGEWFEWIPAEYVDVYVTERGVLVARDVQDFSRQNRETCKTSAGRIES